MRLSRAASRGPEVEDMNALIPAEQWEDVLALAGRAPSIHNTQPWRFRLTGDSVELFADTDRRLDETDPDGREMLISCGAALFGLRLGIRRSGFRPVTWLLPDPARPQLLARVQLGERAPATHSEQRLLAAVRRRHTHRAPFTGEPLPAGLPAALRQDARAEATALVLLRGRHRFERLARLVADADQQQRQQPSAAAEMREWTRASGSPSRDGVPARAYPAHPDRSSPALAQRDFDLGRDWGRIATASNGAAASTPLVTGILSTPADLPADWLRAGQALHRLLLRAAGNWVFATMHTQPLENPPIRGALRAQLRLPGFPQMLFQLGRAGIAPLTARRPTAELLI
jgi:nitroreductase